MVTFVEREVIFMGVKRGMLLFLCSCFFLVPELRAEFNCVFEHLSTDDGLANGSVSGMIRDRKGFMWFATWNGISRYDGYSFKNYRPGEDETTGFASNRIENMLEDSLGNIWVINYHSRAFRWDRFTEKFEPLPGRNSFLSGAKTTAIVPLPSGDVWILTDRAGAFLVVSDTLTCRLSLVHYHSESETALPGNRIDFLFEDAQKDIWIGTDRGVIRLARKDGDLAYIEKPFPVSVKQLFSRNAVSSFLPVDSLVFLGMETGQLYAYHLASDRIFLKELPNSAPIASLAIHSRGDLFVGTKGNGIFSGKMSDLKAFRHFIRPEIRNVLKIHTDTKGLLWVESDRPGISKIDPLTGFVRHYTQKLDVNPDLRPTAQCGLMEDNNGTLWMTLKGGGFGFYNPESDEVDYFYNEPGQSQSRLSNFVNCFYLDPSGVLWMSTYFKGIEKVTFYQDRFRFHQPAPRSSMSIANEVRALLVDSKGFLWVATKKKELYLLDRDGRMVEKMDRLGGESVGMVYALLEDRNGNIYAGSKGNGLFKLIPEGEKRFQVIHYLHDPTNGYSLSDNNIYSLMEDRQGRIWIGTYGGGPNLLINGRFIHPGNDLTGYPQGKAYRVRHIAEDRQGNIWMGTTDGLLFLEKGETFHNSDPFQLFNNELGNVRGLRGNDVFWILCDRHDRIWITSLGGGLSRMVQAPGENKLLEFETFTTENGLPGDMIFTIAEDPKGHLWMSTENGLSFFDPGQKVFRNYGQSDGIVRSGFSEGACALYPDGVLVFGANNGYYAFHPGDFTFEQKKIDLVFTGFQLLGREIAPGAQSVLQASVTETKSIVLKHHQNSFGFSWAGLDYKMQDKLQYECRLEGYDDDWFFSGERNEMAYTKVPPGRYAFTVRFSNPELNEWNSPRTLEITIQPPFWKSTPALFIYLVLVLALVETARRILTTMITLRNKVLVEKALTKAKLDFFTHISHELRTPLTLILGPAAALKDTENLSAKGKEHASLIEQNARRLLRLVNQLLDFRKIQAQKMTLNRKETEILPFVQSVCRTFDELAREKQIRFTVQSDESSPRSRIDEEKMESVLGNILSNAFKFTPEGGTVDVVVSSTADGSETRIDVQDTGIGVSREMEASLFKVFASDAERNRGKYPGTGIGLALAKELVQLHQGEIRYRPTPGGGATFSVILKNQVG
ncbi:MAG TPA: two-component regulator propeller domain-containing protein, partial [Prolixibacteraceae bacterium]|nr:two-component regulator propeller domain-containing protein [Prolixibacteraceae bacterium]